MFGNLGLPSTSCKDQRINFEKFLNSTSGEFPVDTPMEETKTVEINEVEFEDQVKPFSLVLCEVSGLSRVSCRDKLKMFSDGLL